MTSPSANPSTGKALSFEDFSYQRPDMEQLATEFDAAQHAFDEANSLAAQDRALADIYRLRAHFMTMYNIAHIRHTSNTEDVFYEAENSFYDQALPQYESWRIRFYQSLLASPFREALTQRYGRQLFRIAELSLRTFRPEIMPDLQEENRLVSEYVKLKAQARIQLEGDIYNLSTIHVKELDRDRETRRAAFTAKWTWFAENADRMDRIFDELVKLRHQIARKLGFDNFVELGYARMLRTDYGAGDVAVFREHIHRHIVPLAGRLYQRQAQRLGLDQLCYYDEPLLFPDGNPQPRGEPSWIIEQAANMYRELSPETEAFFHFMRQRNLMDLVARDGKATGGYCTYIDEYQAPFIFSNFNGTSGDIDVLTHEAGHAFQVYSSRAIELSEYHWPTFEACEIHSMSMEFFTWPWMDRFFGDRADRYRFVHLSGAIYFLPYGVAVDEFQHWVYENPGASPQERNLFWRELEQKYLPWRNNAGNEFLEAGGMWQKQTHIFANPFYYIDYTLAQVCAFQFWMRDRHDHQSAWEDYIRLCRAGGSLSFLKLVDLAGLQSPFEPDSIAQLSEEIENWLASTKIDA